MKADELKKIVASIRECKQKTLKLRLDVGGTDSLTNEDAKQIAEAIKNNSKIAHLDLWCVRIKVTGEQFATIMQSIPGNITSLKFTECPLRPGDLTALHQCLKGKFIAGDFEVHGNFDDYQPLLNLIKDRFTGHKLKLSCNMPTQAVRYLANILKEKTHLYELEIWRCQVGNAITQIIKNASVRILGLYYVNVDEKTDFYEVMKNNPNLHVLTIVQTSPLNNGKLLVNLNQTALAHIALQPIDDAYAEYPKSFNQALATDYSKERSFLRNLYNVLQYIAEENEEALDKEVNELTHQLKTLKHHKNIDILTDDYHKCILEYHLFKGDVEAMVSTLVNIKDKNQRIKDKMFHYLPLLLNSEQNTTEPPEIKKRRWQLIFLCAKVLDDDDMFGHFKANALSFLLTGSVEPASNSPSYCDSMMQTKPNETKQIVIEIALLEQQLLSAPQELTSLNKLKFNEFMQEASNPQMLMTLLFKEQGELKRQLAAQNSEMQNMRKQQEEQKKQNTAEMEAMDERLQKLETLLLSNLDKSDEKKPDSPRLFK